MFFFLLLFLLLHFPLLLCHHSAGHFILGSARTLPKAKNKKCVFFSHLFFFSSVYEMCASFQNGIDLNFLCKLRDDEIKINCIIVANGEKVPKQKRERIYSSFHYPMVRSNGWAKKYEKRITSQRFTAAQRK